MKGLKAINAWAMFFDIHLIQKRFLWALAIGHWEAIFWRSLKQSISLFSYSQTIASQCPIANAQSNLFWIRCKFRKFVTKMKKIAMRLPLEALEVDWRLMVRMTRSGPFYTGTSCLEPLEPVLNSQHVLNGVKTETLCAQTKLLTTTCWESEKIKLNSVPEELANWTDSE